MGGGGVASVGLCCQRISPSLATSLAQLVYLPDSALCSSLGCLRHGDRWFWLLGGGRCSKPPPISPIPVSPRGDPLSTSSRWPQHGAASLGRGGFPSSRSWFTSRCTRSVCLMCVSVLLPPPPLLPPHRFCPLVPLKRRSPEDDTGGSGALGGGCIRCLFHNGPCGAWGGGGVGLSSFQPRFRGLSC